MQLTKTDVCAVLEVVEEITDRDYTWQDMVALCIPAEAIAVFDGIEPVPAKNVLQSLALFIGADVWKTCINDNGTFLFHRLKVCVRQRAIELQKSLED